MRRWIVRGLVVAAIGSAALQLLPFDRVEERPVSLEAPWASEEARRLAVAACYDCHSNVTRLEWFDRIAPGSWLVARHVRDGRAAVNFSEWDREQDGDDWADAVADGEMPPRSYTWAHPAARLNARERRTLVAALEQLEEPGDGDRGDAGRGRGRGRGGRDGQEG